MNKKRKQKGFTLIELIIVLAIFSIIMALVMSFIDPVAKLMSKTSVKERTAAYVNNIEGYVENSIHYAKYIRVFEGGYSEVSDETVPLSVPVGSTDVDKADKVAAKNFVDHFLNGVVDANGNPITGKVRILKLINTAEDTLEAGKIYESVYDFTAKKSWDETVEDGVDAEGNTKYKTINHELDPSIITASVVNREVINDEHFKDYDYYYRLGFFTLDPIPAGTIADKDPKPGEYYSWLVPMKDNAGNDVTIDKSAGKNFSLNVVAYQNGNKEDVTYNDGTSDINATIFKSPSHMSTASMAFINAIKANDATSVSHYKLKYKNDGTLDTQPDGSKKFEKLASVDSGLAFRVLSPGFATTDNIYIVYILPEEIYDTTITYN